MSGESGGGPKRSVYDDHLRLWLRGLTGCHFASSVAGEGRINYVDQLDELVETDVPMLNGSIDAAVDDEFFTVILFPRVRTPRGIIRVLRALCENERWSARRVPWRNKHPRAGVTPIGLEFRAASGERSSVMGLAPLGCMPVTRRAPYVALAVYGGPKANTHKRTPAGELGFIDARTLTDDKEIDEEGHERLWKATKERVKALSQDPPEDHFWMKEVAFFLSDDIVDSWLIREN